MTNLPLTVSQPECQGLRVMGHDQNVCSRTSPGLEMDFPTFNVMRTN